MFPTMLKLFTIRRSNQLISISKRNYTPRRCLLYVPGDNLRKLSKAFKLNADCIAMDCEDGVAINKKENARLTIKDILDNQPKLDQKFNLAVRVNSIESGLCADDLRIILSAKNKPNTILLPKVERSDDLKLFSDELNKHIGDKIKINLIIYIESAIAFLNLRDILQIGENLSKSDSTKLKIVTLVFGSDDFCANIGATRTESSTEILYARQKLVLYAKAFNLQAIDMVYIKYKDLDGLKRQCEEGAKMGYTGKQVIHPGQIDIVQEAFLPNNQQIEWARGLLQAFDEHQKSGKGAFNYKGSMIDMPTMKQAQNIINLVDSVKK